MDPHDMPTTLTIPEEYLKEISQGKEPVAELLTFLNDHVQLGLLDYENLISFEGYEDDNGGFCVISLKDAVSEDVISLTANLQYSLVEQQNSCSDSLASISHSVRLIYTYRFGEDSVEVEHDPAAVGEPDLTEYGY